MSQERDWAPYIPILGIIPIHSYSFRMGLEPEKSYSIGRGSDGFLGIYNWLRLAPDALGCCAS